MEKAFATSLIISTGLLQVVNSFFQAVRARLVDGLFAELLQEAREVFACVKQNSSLKVRHTSLKGLGLRFVVKCS